MGITDNSWKDLLKLRRLQKITEPMLLLFLPPIILPISQSEFIDYLEDLVPQLPLPFLMYNMPSCTKLHMSLRYSSKGKRIGSNWD